MKSESETCVLIDDKVQVCLKSKDLNFAEKAAWRVFRWAIDVLFPCMETRHANPALWQGSAAARANADCAKRERQLHAISAEIELLSAQNEKLAEEVAAFEKIRKDQDLTSLGDILDEATKE